MSKKQKPRQDETKPNASEREENRPTDDSSTEENAPTAEQTETAEKEADTAPEDPDSEKSGERPFPIVGIGASAGGFEAILEFLEAMPPENGMALVVVMHQHPEHTSMLPDLFGKHTSIPVQEVEDGVTVEPDHLYLVPPGKQLAMIGGKLQTMDPEGKGSPHLPIDYFLRSLAADQQERAIGIILSGTGTDGTQGIREIKAHSGMAMAEKPEVAKYAGMPASAIATGCVDYVLPPDEMPRQLIEYVRGPYLQGREVAEFFPSFPTESMQKVFVLLRNETGHDFSSYKENTLRRRIERRMNVHQIEHPNLYVGYLQENPEEIQHLFQELLISVTSFFRDPVAWEALEEEIDRLLDHRRDATLIRAWVPGCATGEEAYSLAILLHERLEKRPQRPAVQIFGTDLDAKAIDIARTGEYPEGIRADVSEARLRRYFHRVEHGFAVEKEVREMVVFAPHNLIKDPPFTDMDILTCRNLLIYLRSELKKKLLPLFRYALKPKGVLFLGPSESVGLFEEMFEVRDKRWKIYQSRKEQSDSFELPELPENFSGQKRGEDSRRRRSESEKNEPSLTPSIERLLLDQFTPASVVVDEEGEIVHIHGRTGRYLEPAPGRPRHQLVEMAREGLKIELADALWECRRTERMVLREKVGVKTNGDEIHIQLQVRKLRDPEPVRGLFLVTFRPIPPPLVEAEEDLPEEGDSETNRRVARLERELEFTKASHQTTLEELETSNEELKSTNEELQSTNEELQSTNEELETSKEELQSLNEELSTVNHELQSKVEELSRSNDDMQNLLNSTDIATVFLDNDLVIQRYTEQATDLVKLRPSDIGRPLSELATNLQYKRIAEDCRKVLKTLVYRQKEVLTLQGKWYLMRILPYRTSKNVIKGVVLTFVSINRLKEIEKAGELGRSYFENIVDTLRTPILVLNGDLRVISANRAFYREFPFGEKQTEGALIYRLGSGQWDEKKLRKLLEEILPEDNVFEGYELEAVFPNLGRRNFLLNGRRLEQSEEKEEMILLVLEDVTEAPE